jgi:hypothetical protein
LAMALFEQPGVTAGLQGRRDRAERGALHYDWWEHGRGENLEAATLARVPGGSAGDEGGLERSIGRSCLTLAGRPVRPGIRACGTWPIWVQLRG